jgi:hypothetical protein
LLQHSLRCVELPGVDHAAEVLQELGKKIKEGQGKPKKGTKAQKVKLNLTVVCLIKCIYNAKVVSLFFLLRF